MNSHKVGINKPLAFVFLVVLIDCMGIRIIYPVIVTLITGLNGMPLQLAIRYSGWLMMLFAAMQFIFSPLVGALSDAFGRRPVLLLSLIGLSVNYYLLSVANTLFLIFMGRIISGICSASISTGFAYVADISEPGNKTRNFGIMGAAIALGFILGPLAGGILSELGPRAPFAGAAILSTANFLYGYVVLPESLPPQRRNAFQFRNINPFGVFLKWNRYKANRKFLLVLFLFSFATQVLPAVWPFYTRYVYHWTDAQIGYSLAFAGSLMALVKSFLVSKIQIRFGPTKTILTGLLFTATGLVLISFAGKAGMLYLAIIIYSIGAITTPSLQGLISDRVPETEQGQLQGVIVSLISLAGIFSPLLMTHLFWSFTSSGTGFFFAGIPFLVAAGIILASLLCLPVRLRSY